MNKKTILTLEIVESEDGNWEIFGRNSEGTLVSFSASEILLSPKLTEIQKRWLATLLTVTADKWLHKRDMDNG